MARTSSKRCLVTGAGGFIGHHLVRHLKQQGHYVIGADIVHSPYLKYKEDFDKWFLYDLKNYVLCESITQNVDEVYNLAALNGSIEFTTNNRAELVHNNALINLNMSEACWKNKVKKVFFSSSACVYPIELQSVKEQFNLMFNHSLTEEDAYPADPDTEYGWEKLFSERVYQSYAKDRGMNIRIARFINIYGTECLIDTLKSKAPLALTRKVIEAENGGIVNVWGSGNQVRTFCHIDDLLRGIDLLMESDETSPINLGSDRGITIDQLVYMIAEIEGIHITIHHQTDKVEGVYYRVPDMTRTRKLLRWEEVIPLEVGLKEVNTFVHQQLVK